MAEEKPLEYRDVLTKIGRFYYDRMTMPDDQREPGDPVRYTDIEPCCMEHTPGRVCGTPRKLCIKNPYALGM